MEIAKLEMILEYESVMPESYFLNDKWFPNFIIFRKDKESEPLQGEVSEW